MTKREARYHLFKKYIKSVDEKMAAMENLTDLGIAGSSFTFIFLSNVPLHTPTFF